MLLKLKNWNFPLSKNCLCLKDIEDSELLELMDVCDQESSLSPPTQQDMLHTDTPAPSTAQVSKRGNVF